MIHGQNNIEFFKFYTTEQSVRRIRSQSHDPIIPGSFDRRNNHILLFFPIHTVLAGMGIESQYGNPGLPDGKIFLQTSIQQLQFIVNIVDRNISGNIPERQMIGNESHLHLFTHQQRHDITGFISFAKKYRTTRCGLKGIAPLRSSYQDIDLIPVQSSQSSLQCQHRRIVRFRRLLAQIHFDRIVDTIDDITPFRIRITGILNTIQTEIFYI